MALNGMIHGDVCLLQSGTVSRKRVFAAMSITTVSEMAVGAEVNGKLVRQKPGRLRRRCFA